MPDIGVEIVSPDKAASTVEVPIDMKAGDFLAELAEMIPLKGTGWRLHDKDLHRDLDPELTLEANGVEAGHHLYFKKPDLPAPPPQLPPAPPPVMSRWLWIAPAIGAFLLGAAVSSLVRSKTPDPEIAVLKRQLQERTATISELRAKLDEGAKSIDEKTRDLMTELAAKTTEAQETKTQLASVTRDLQANRKRVVDLLAQQTAGNGQLAELRKYGETLKARGDQVDAQLAHANQTVQALQNENARLTTQLAAAQSKKGSSPPPPSAQTEIGMFVWSGKVKGKLTVDIAGKAASVGDVVRGSLPTAPAIIYQGYQSDSDRVEIKQVPTAQNRYHLIFVRKNGGNDTAVFFWIK